MNAIATSSPAASRPTVNSHRSYRHYVTGKRAYFIIKRLLDIVLSMVVLLLLLSWLTPLLAIWLKMESRGPVFFLQKRVGRGGRSFTCYKFRTMVVNKDADRRQAVPGDRRITRSGRWMRAWNVDELPQFLNVLQGHMSIVGPRPHMYADCRLFAGMIPRYKLRTLVKPGITGLAQIKGYHGPAADPEKAFLRYRWDIYYLRNASLGLDLRIMVRTLTNTWLHAGAVF